MVLTVFDSVWQRLVAFGIFLNLGSTGRNFAPSEPFWTSRDIFNAYASRGLDLAQFFVVPGIPWRFQIHT